MCHSVIKSCPLTVFFNDWLFNSISFLHIPVHVFIWYLAFILLQLILIYKCIFRPNTWTAFFFWSSLNIIFSKKKFSIHLKKKMSTFTHLLHLHNFLFKTSISIINWNTYNANQEFIWCLPVAFYIFFPLICTFFWTLCAIWVAPIKISSSFIGLIRSATCKFEKNCHVIKNTP